MATNEGWPEAFGFALSHGTPCIVSWIEDGGSAQQSGLQVRRDDKRRACVSIILKLMQCGDVLVDVDNEDVREWSVVDVIERARIADKVTIAELKHNIN